MKDSYGWLRDKNYPEVKNQKILDFLNKENEETSRELGKISGIRSAIYNELRSRVLDEDNTVPIKMDSYYYYSCIKPGMEYWVHLRKKDNIEEIILDENIIARGCDYFDVGSVEISPNHKFLAYSVDVSGNEIFDIKVKNIQQGKIVDFTVFSVFSDIEWSKDSKGFFYIPVSKNWRAKEVYYHTIGTSKDDDICIYKEEDDTFSVNIYKSNDKNYLIIESGSKEENESSYIDLRDNNFNLKLFSKRKKNRFYFIDKHREDFYILTNDVGKNFRIAKASDANTEEWSDFIAHSDESYIRDFDLYSEHIAITSSNTKTGVMKIEIRNFINGNVREIKFRDNESYFLKVIFTNYHSDSIRIEYSSLKEPLITKEYNFASWEEEVLKVEKSYEGFDKENYITKRLYVKARDGKSIPVSVIYNKTKFNKQSLYLYGYGAYGISIAPSYKRNIFSLLDRGFIYAIAHIRGGDDLGYQWYENGKFLNKKNTFYDFIDVAEFLKKKYCTDITIAGGSAGGMLIGFCINERSDLFKTAIAHVPFVDVFNTMMDDSLPLTPGEFKEWGNPKDIKYRDYILSYSPYENVKKQKYPNIFVTAGINDPRVTYWEPAKWVAKLREHKLDNNLLLLKTNMHAGHAGNTGRYSFLKEIADEYAFVIKNK